MWAVCKCMMGAVVLSTTEVWRSVSRSKGCPVRMCMAVCITSSPPVG